MSAETVTSARLGPARAATHSAAPIRARITPDRRKAVLPMCLHDPAEHLQAGDQARHPPLAVQGEAQPARHHHVLGSGGENRARHPRDLRPVDCGRGRRSASCPSRPRAGRNHPRRGCSRRPARGRGLESRPSSAPGKACDAISRSPAPVSGRRPRAGTSGASSHLGFSRRTAPRRPLSHPPAPLRDRPPRITFRQSDPRAGLRSCAKRPCRRFSRRPNLRSPPYYTCSLGMRSVSGIDGAAAAARRETRHEPRWHLVEVTLEVVSAQRGELGGARSHTCTESGGSIGRGSDNSWVLPDPNHYVSRRHAGIRWSGGRFLITDTSTNGVFVNGAALGRDGQARLVGRRPAGHRRLRDRRPAAGGRRRSGGVGPVASRS